MFSSESVTVIYMEVLAIVAELSDVPSLSVIPVELEVWPPPPLPVTAMVELYATVRLPLDAFSLIDSSLVTVYDRPEKVTTPEEAVTAAVPPIVPLPAVDVLLDNTAEIVTCVEESLVTVFEFES